MNHPGIAARAVAGRRPRFGRGRWAIDGEAPHHDVVARARDDHELSGDVSADVGRAVRPPGVEWEAAFERYSKEGEAPGTVGGAVLVPDHDVLVEHTAR